MGWDVSACEFDTTDTSILNIGIHRPLTFNQPQVVTHTKMAPNLAPSKHELIYATTRIRDFLITHRGLYEWWPKLRFDYESPSHEKLKQRYNIYINHKLISTSVSRLLSESDSHDGKKFLTEYPFLEYASRTILYYANAAAKGIPQTEYLSSFPISNWININNLFEKFKQSEIYPECESVLRSSR